MLCIDNTCTDVYFNLAAEEYLLKNSTEDIFMLWQNEPSVIIGKYQNIYREVNVPYAQENGLKLARRFSGGGAVYHDAGNLNFTFIETRRNPDFDRYVEVLKNVLAQWNVPVESDERRGLYVDNLKISGSAQSIHKNRVLFHATLLVDSNLEKLERSLEGAFDASTLNRGKEKFSVPSVKSPVSNLLSFLPKETNLQQVKESVLSYFSSSANSVVSDIVFFEKSRREINALKEHRYTTKDWIYAFSSLPVGSEQGARSDTPPA